jgi:hypothetical protein
MVLRRRAAIFRTVVRPECPVVARPVLRHMVVRLRCPVPV